MKRKTIAVIGNTFDWTHKSGYSFGNGLYYELSKKYFVKIIVPTRLDFFAETKKYINTNMVVENIFSSKGALLKMDKITEPLYWERFIHEDETMRNELIRAVGNADVIICNSLHLSKLVFSSFQNRSIVFRELDPLYYAKCDFYEHTPLAEGEKIEDRRLLESIYFELEKDVVEKSSYMLMLTEGDEAIFLRLYNADPAKMIRMPLCVKDAEKYDNYIPKERADADKQINCVYISNKYCGSDRLLSKILRIAEDLSNFNFHIIGTCCESIAGITLPANCFAYGVISERKKNEIYNIADCALNVPWQRHGMHAKNFDYILNGLTILADNEGVRGFNMSENVHYFPVAFETLEEDLRGFASIDYSGRRNIALNAYNDIISEFRYENYIPAFERLVGLPTNNADGNDNTLREECYIWGTKKTGASCHNQIKISRYNCIGFIDNDENKQGAELLGQTVFAFTDVINYVLKNNTKIIIAVGYVKAIIEIYKQISSVLPSNNVILYYKGIFYDDNLNLNKLLESV